MSQSTNDRIIISQLNPKSPVSEAYRMLRTNIQYSSVDTDLQVLMITSAGPGEGKTTTVGNLAVTYAQADQKVLVIDADLRKPTMHRIFRQSNRTGLSTVLTNQSDVNHEIKSTDIPNLHILTSGPIPPNPSELLNSNRMRTLLEELKQSYTRIIIDTPPTLVITDAQIVSTLCQGVILVIDSEKVKKDAAIKAKASLDKVNANIIGVVLNNVSQKNNDSYYYYYYYGKEEQ